jgi:hypothetical protein
VFRSGVGTTRDLAKAFAHYQVALELGNAAAAKPLEEISREISPAEKSVAVDLTQKLRAELKPIPTIWDMQYVGIAAPASRWSIANAELIPTPTAPKATAAPTPATPTPTPLPILPIR